jgi:hypothetical protein
MPRGVVLPLELPLSHFFVSAPLMFGVLSIFSIELSFGTAAMEFGCGWLTVRAWSPVAVFVLTGVFSVSACALYCVCVGVCVCVCVCVGVVSRVLHWHNHSSRLVGQKVTRCFPGKSGAFVTKGCQGYVTLRMYIRSPNHHHSTTTVSCPWCAWYACTCNRCASSRAPLLPSSHVVRVSPRTSQSTVTYRKFASQPRHEQRQQHGERCTVAGLSGAGRCG